MQAQICPAGSERGSEQRDEGAWMQKREAELRRAQMA